MTPKFFIFKALASLAMAHANSPTEPGALVGTKVGAGSGVLDAWLGPNAAPGRGSPHASRTLTPVSPPVQPPLGTQPCVFRRGDGSWRDSLTAYLRLEPDSPIAYSYRAACYEALGNKAAANRDRVKAKQMTGPSRIWQTRPAGSGPLKAITSTEPYAWHSSRIYRRRELKITKMKKKCNFGSADGHCRCGLG
jgi:hypothetical protein